VRAVNRALLAEPDQIGRDLRFLFRWLFRIVKIFFPGSSRIWTSCAASMYDARARTLGKEGAIVCHGQASKWMQRSTGVDQRHVFRYQ
jgi:hypothetical protein